MAVLTFDTAIEAIKSMTVNGIEEQRAFTEAVAQEAAAVVQAFSDLDLKLVSRKMATMILCHLR